MVSRFRHVHVVGPLLLAVHALAPPAAAQQELAKLFAGDAAADARFGTAVALDGGRALVGAPLADDLGSSSGTAYVFQGGGSSWTQTAELHGSPGDASDEFGHAVALGGGRALVGAPFAPSTDLHPDGAAFIFELQGSTWVQVARLVPLDVQPNARFGWSVALDGDRAAVGAPFANANKGAVYIFERFGIFGWIQTAKILSGESLAFDQFGTSVALQGGRLVAGAPFADHIFTQDLGAAYVFDLAAGTYVLTVKLIPSSGAVLERFGAAVSLSGDSCVVGAPDADLLTGAVDVFAKGGIFGLWQFQERLLAHDGDYVENFGASVALDGDRALVGAPGHPGVVFGSGAVYVFTRAAGAWTERCQFVSGFGTFANNLGTSVALDGAQGLAGDELDDEAASNAGAAYVFDTNAVLPYGCGTNPPGSLVELSGVPAVGKTWTLGVHNPLGTQVPGSLAYAAVSAGPDPAFPCGTALPGWGMAAPGAPGELLVALAPAPLVVGPSIWDGAGPAPVTHAFPSDPSFVGADIYVQGAMVGAAGSAVAFGLAEAFEACIGVGVP